MLPFRDINRFIKHNEKHIRNYLNWRYGFRDYDVVNDIVQNFYIELIRNRALERYDCTKGGFDHYVYTNLGWSMAKTKSKKRITTVSLDNPRLTDYKDGGSPEEEVFDAAYDPWEPETLSFQHWIETTIHPRFQGKALMLMERVRLGYHVNWGPKQRWLQLVRRYRTAMAAAPGDQKQRFDKPRTYRPKPKL